MAEAATRSLVDILQVAIRVEIVDVGSNLVDGPPPYQPMLTRGVANVVGFEPNPNALARLNAEKGPNETYLPYAVGDGKPHTYHRCYLPGMNSLLEPNAEFLAYLHDFPEWGTVLDKLPITTVRLDDVPQVGKFDYLKIDIQGGELMVFENAVQRLADCLVIQTEVEFVPMYVDQPLFAEVDQFMRRHGFMIHCFFPLATRCIQPLIAQGDKTAGLNQITWADAVFIRDFTRFDRLNEDQLLRMALILHDVYGSYDIVVRLLMEHDRRKHSEFVQAYRAAFSASSPI